MKNIMKNSSESSVVKSGGIGFFGLLTLLFIGLKLGEVGVVATWSWLWILSPMWIPIAIFSGIIVIIGIIALIARIV